MTNDGARALMKLVQRKVTKVSLVLGAGFLALIVGFLTGSTPGQAVGILIFMAAVVYAFVLLRGRGSSVSDEQEGAAKQDTGPTSPDASMKTLLFDDFQTSNGKYVVREVEQEGKVVPSTKTARPVAMTVKPETIRDMEIPDFFDLDSDAAYSDAEPRSEFHSLLNKLLQVLKEVLFAHSAAFFWVNNEKRQLVLESVATESNCFMTGKRFAMDEDLVSQVALTGKPQVLGRVNPSSEQELLRYYDAPSGVQSVLGVPVFYMNGSNGITPVGVIVADSMAEDQFGNETLALLGRFTKLASALIKSYTDKYDLLLDAELLSSIRRMHDRIGSAPTEESVLAGLIEEANRLATWECLTVVMYSEEHNDWVVQRAVNKGANPYVGPHLVIDRHGSLTAEVIRTNTVKSIDDLANSAMVRFHPSEPAAGPGSFLCVPISTFNRCYGALTLESRTPGNFRGSETETIYRLVQNTAAILEVIYMNAMAREQMPVDYLTGALTRKHFQRRVEEEVQRASDFGTELALVSVAIDSLQEQSTRYGTEGADATVAAVARILRASIRPYDALGRQGDGRLGVLLIQTPASDAYLWAEKIRKQIAGQVISVGPRTFSVTVSIGICGLSEGMCVEEFVSGTDQVLAKAVEHGGNLVRVH